MQLRGIALAGAFALAACGGGDKRTVLTVYSPHAKDLLTFYKSPLGTKLLVTEPRAIQFSMSYMNQWAQQFAATIDVEFRNEMKKRGKPI